MTRLTLFSRASTKTKVISTITDVQMYESPSFDLLTTGLMKRGDKVCTFSDNRHNIMINRFKAGGVTLTHMRRMDFPSLII